MTVPSESSSSPARKHYLRVVVVWIITLAALYAFQQLFS
jgi:hypothetical protein